MVIVLMTNFLRGARAIARPVVTQYAFVTQKPV